MVLLSAPTEVLLTRIDSRTTNPYGKTTEERTLILNDLAEVEPLLRAICTHEIDTAHPIGDVVARLVEIGKRSLTHRDAQRRGSSPEDVRGLSRVRYPQVVEGPIRTTSGRR